MFRPSPAQERWRPARLFTDPASWKKLRLPDREKVLQRINLIGKKHRVKNTLDPETGLVWFMGMNIRTVEDARRAIEIFSHEYVQVCQNEQEHAAEAEIWRQEVAKNERRQREERERAAQLELRCQQLTGNSLIVDQGQRAEDKRGPLQPARQAAMVDNSTAASRPVPRPDITEKKKQPFDADSADDADTVAAATARAARAARTARAARAAAELEGPTPIIKRTKNPLASDSDENDGPAPKRAWPTRPPFPTAPLPVQEEAPKPAKPTREEASEPQTSKWRQFADSVGVCGLGSVASSAKLLANALQHDPSGTGSLHRHGENYRPVFERRSTRYTSQIRPPDGMSGFFGDAGRGARRFGGSNRGHIARTRPSVHNYGQPSSSKHFQTPGPVTKWINGVPVQVVEDGAGAPADDYAAYAPPRAPMGMHSMNTGAKYDPGAAYSRPTPTPITSPHIALPAPSFYTPYPSRPATPRPPPAREYLLPPALRSGWTPHPPASASHTSPPSSSSQLETAVPDSASLSSSIQPRPTISTLNAPITAQTRTPGRRAEPPLTVPTNAAVSKPPSRPSGPTERPPTIPQTQSPAPAQTTVPSAQSRMTPVRPIATSPTPTAAASATSQLQAPEGGLKPNAPNTTQVGASVQKPEPLLTVPTKADVSKPPLQPPGSTSRSPTRPPTQPSVPVQAPVPSPLQGFPPARSYLTGSRLTRLTSIVHTRTAGSSWDAEPIPRRAPPSPIDVIAPPPEAEYSAVPAEKVSPPSASTTAPFVPDYPVRSPDGPVTSPSPLAFPVSSPAPDDDDDEWADMMRELADDVDAVDATQFGQVGADIGGSGEYQAFPPAEEIAEADEAAEWGDMFGEDVWTDVPESDNVVPPLADIDHSVAAPPAAQPVRPLTPAQRPVSASNPASPGYPSAPGKRRDSDASSVFAAGRCNTRPPSAPSPTKESTVTVLITVRGTPHTLTLPRRNYLPAIEAFCRANNLRRWISDVADVTEHYLASLP
ncbi:hypothetical protein BDK51DRAFT_30798 [Blyttiomyces helicus]|uniref:Uncharacterized protein n=1 Tax=Blyttiomyces helicus TaxID=388810 RepID=A0A4P9WH34_9FUNG|nr:hypothetical protein BDK51DRAFT_30798 [Blyttiomyces helicus]|eukprot:RKO91672.1 hypothetical protein BDK51DRAFT_30798 [Blyttiomyces helicus]